MGTDIHTVIEMKIDDRWVGLTASDSTPQNLPIYARRDYNFFSQLAGVRGKGPREPQGLPEDISELARHHYSFLSYCHHSASHMPLDEFCAIHNKIWPECSRAKYAVEDLTGIYLDEGGEYRVVFWFDN